MKRKRVGSRLDSEETEREREMECCSKRVLAWAINLTVGGNVFDRSRRIILDHIKMNI